MRADPTKLKDVVRRLKAGEDRAALLQELYPHPAPPRSTNIPPPVNYRVPVRPLPCVHLGQVVEWCHTCQTGERHVHDCAFHERCTRGAVPRSPYRTCETCGDYAPTDDVKRHLLYHVWPRSGTPAWRTRVASIRRRLALFNGRRLVCVMQSGGCDSAEAVRAAFGGEVELVTAANDPNRREVVSWLKLWPMLGPLTAHDAVFWGHAKGITKPWNPGVTVHRWAELIEEMALEYWPLVLGLMAQYPIVGSFLKSGHGFQGLSSAWHYTGGMFWVRGDAAHWDTIPRNRYGTEAWPGIVFPENRAGIIFGHGQVSSYDLYRMSVLQEIERDYAAWCSTNSHFHCAAGSAISTTSS